MTKSAKKILIEARELIAPEERWTQGWFAKNGSNQRVWPDSNLAQCWCSIGAVKKIAPGAFRAPKAFEVLADVMGDNIGEFNDTHTHAEVLAAFDRAIAIA